MSILYAILLKPCHASGLSTDTGEIIGYTYIGLTALIVLCYGLLYISKYKTKGTLMILSQLIIFTQFCRYLPLLNFKHSTFFTQVWKTFSKSQDPYELLDCRSSDTEFHQVGYESTNFICNSWAHLALITLCLVLSAVFLSVFRTRNARFLKEFWVFVFYSSATDLSLSSYLQIKHVTTTQLDFDGIIEIIGSASAILYLTGAVCFVSVQFYFLAKERYDLVMVQVVKEEFVLDKRYYFYCFYLILIVKMLLYTFLLVFGRGAPYATPVVIGIMCLVVCNLYVVAYLLSRNPYGNTRNIVFSSVIEGLECLLLAVPVMYEYDLIPDLVLDIIFICLFFIGLTIYCTRTYFDYSIRSVGIIVEPDRSVSIVLDETVNKSSHKISKKSIPNDPEDIFVNTVQPLNYNKDPQENIDRVNNKPVKEADKNLFFTFPGNSGSNNVSEPMKSVEKSDNFFRPIDSNRSNKVSETNFKHFLPRVEDEDNIGSNRFLSPSSHSKNYNGANMLSSQTNLPIKPKFNLNDFTVRSRRD